jgi:hypothetical protein
MHGHLVDPCDVKVVTVEVTITFIRALRITTMTILDYFNEIGTSQFERGGLPYRSTILRNPIDISP